MNILIDSFIKHHNSSNIKTIYNNDIKNILNDELNILFYIYMKNSIIFKIIKFVLIQNAHALKNVLELENFRKKYNENNPSSTECQGVQSFLPSYKNHKTSIIIIIPLISILVLSSLLFIVYKVITLFIYLFTFRPFGSCFPFRRKRHQRKYSNFTNEEAHLLYTKVRSRTPEAHLCSIAYNSI
ncbi:hypothetical protein PCYB_004840 [Plasmodium cynomolgi strain B]|uniref:CYIR protein n=1 Tax=Plasmodium cynomolgi (strain B) TaxID=1120755 RepID=K6V328_PLACD|nr:hypothetical protein PCYB_004840 [Plasmodium cynomolgi strain B]GAB69735.1 hypothetical protein PCYB_004840 [Plasmodium cynomolgi strain B]